MRTTLDIDDDVLQAAKELAASQRSTAGKVLSDLARKALTKPLDSASSQRRNAFRMMPPTDGIVTPEMIDRLREDDF
jgi:hypothetical protein